MPGTSPCEFRARRHGELEVSVAEMLFICQPLSFHYLQRLARTYQYEQGLPATSVKHSLSQRWNQLELAGGWNDPLPPGMPPMILDMKICRRPERIARRIPA